MKDFDRLESEDWLKYMHAHRELADVISTFSRFEMSKCSEIARDILYDTEAMKAISLWCETAGYNKGE